MNSITSSMLNRVRSILLIMEEGSINRAALRLGVSQPTLTRQVQALEAELGAELFERTPSGVLPTALAFRLSELMRPVAQACDRAWAEVAAHAQGRQNQLRVGYLGLSAARFLTPALERFRAAHPDVKLWLFDQTPEEQLRSLKNGELDLALIGQEGASLGESFYQQRLARLGVLAALPSHHSLAARENIRLAELADETFIVPSESVVPGRKNWVTEICRKAGFRPRYGAETLTVADTFTRLVAESSVCLLPDYMEKTPPPGVTFTPIKDRFAHWDFVALRQRGRLSTPCKDFIRWLS